MIRPELWQETEVESGCFDRNARIEHRIQKLYFTTPEDVYIPRTDGWAPKSWFDKEPSVPFDEDDWEEEEEY